ncbi:MAG: signal peptidase II [Phycisphaerae bacterium]|nr:signal peptidase II [Phycisphaerae bacterium]
MSTMPKAARPAWMSPRSWCVLLGVLAATLALDLWSKAWSFEHVAEYAIVLPDRETVADPSYRLPFHEGIRVVPGSLLDFHLVLNRGAVFGIGQQQRWLFVCFSILAVLVGLWIFARWTRERMTMAHVGIALVLAGGLGNLYDRLLVGAVRDFLHMLPRWNLPFGLAWPGGATEVFPWVFNVADVSLLVGLALLYLHSRREELRRERAKAR